MLQPGSITLEQMRAFYTGKSLDILKDAVSLPGEPIERRAKLYNSYIAQNAIVFRDMYLQFSARHNNLHV